MKSWWLCILRSKLQLIDRFVEETNRPSVSLPCFVANIYLVFWVWLFTTQMVRFSELILLQIRCYSQPTLAWQYFSVVEKSKHTLLVAISATG